MEKEYLYVLDFGDCTINCLHLHDADKKPDEFKDTEELLRYWGFNPDTCMYMYSSDELEINNIVIPLND